MKQSFRSFSTHSSEDVTKIKEWLIKIVSIARKSVKNKRKINKYQLFETMQKIVALCALGEEDNGSKKEKKVDVSEKKLKGKQVAGVSSKRRK